MLAGQGRQDRIETFSFAGAALVAAVLCWVLLLGSGKGSGQSIALSGRINPNTASMQSLTRLSGIGPARAQAIVRYRGDYTDSDGPAFGSVDDLQKVHGIGPITAARLEKWLEFETEPAKRCIVFD